MNCEMKTKAVFFRDTVMLGTWMYFVTHISHFENKKRKHQYPQKPLIFSYSTSIKKLHQSSLNALLIFRLHGSYEALKYGTSLDGLSDLTGGIAESIPIRPSSTELPATLSHLLKLTTIVLAKIDDSSREKTDTNERVVPRGITPGECYRISALHKVNNVQ